MMMMTTTKAMQVPQVKVLPLLLLLVAGFAVNAQQDTTTTSGPPYDGCTIEEYYAPLIDEAGGSSDPTQWNKDSIVNLIQSTHRNVLPIQSPGNDDVYQALINLYPGDTPNETVHLVYRDISYPASPYANSQSWSRGNIWPEDRRTELKSLDEQLAADADVHGNVPSDTTVFANKGVLFYGECGTVQIPELCRELAETNLTETDDKIWQPPPSQRGSQARLAFYMAARYEMDLSDCPPFEDNTFGYKSQLLDWHLATEPSQEEKDRNTKACQRWQGNRNPFIDYPELVEVFYGQPDTLREGYRAYDKCFVDDENNNRIIATMAPTAAPNGCDDVEAGEIQMILEHSNPEPQQMAFFTLNNIKHDVERIYVTTRPWDGTNFLNNGKGTIAFDVPPETAQLNDNETYNGLAPGYLYAYGFDQSNVVWEDVSGDTGGTNFSLNVDGDSILTYCIDSDGYPRFIHGFSYSPNGWMDPGLSVEDYGNTSSALPDQIKDSGSVAVPYFQNNKYNGTVKANLNFLLQEYGDPDNYVGCNGCKWDIEQLANKTQSSGAVAVAFAGTTTGWVALLMVGAFSSVIMPWIL